MNKTFFLVGQVSAISPLTVALKDSVIKGVGHKLPRNGSFKAKPYFPATSIRGALRNCGELALVRHLEKMGIRLSLQDHFALAQGVDINNYEIKNTDENEKSHREDVNSSSIDATLALRTTNPFISIWGRWGVEGKLNIGNMLPLSEDCVGNFGGGARTIMFERNEQMIDFLTEEDAEKLTSLIAKQSAGSKEAGPISKEKKALEKALSKQDDATKEITRQKIAELENSLATIKNGVETIRRPIDTYEAFVAGCQFSHRITLKNANMHELSMLILALREFAKHPRLGGHKAHDCGLVHAEYNVMTWNDDLDENEVVATIRWDDTGFKITSEKTDSINEAYQILKSFEENFSQFDFKKW